MKKFYISSHKDAGSFATYAHDFFELILRDYGYQFVDGRKSLSEVLSQVASRDHVHLEVGSSASNEIKILQSMLRANYKQVVVTLHHPDYIKNAQRGKINWFPKIGSFFHRPNADLELKSEQLSKIKTIYVLSETDAQVLKNRYNIDNVVHIPALIQPMEEQETETVAPNLIYLGNNQQKDVLYSLQLHRELVKHAPQLTLYVPGLSDNKDHKDYTELSKKFVTNVQYQPAASEQQLNTLLDNVAFAVVPEGTRAATHQNQRYLWQSLKKQKLLLAGSAPANCIDYAKATVPLSGQLRTDAKAILNLIQDKKQLQSKKEAVAAYLQEYHSTHAVLKKFKP